MIRQRMRLVEVNECRRHHGVCHDGPAKAGGGGRVTSEESELLHEGTSINRVEGRERRGDEQDGGEPSRQSERGPERSADECSPTERHPSK